MCSSMCLMVTLVHHCECSRYSGWSVCCCAQQQCCCVSRAEQGAATCAAADMDGFKLLEIVGLELGLPVISAYPQQARTLQLLCSSQL
jgi:hypothetical protein